MQFTWSPFPFFRLLFPFLGGIIFEIYLRIPIASLQIIIISISTLLLLWLIIKKLGLNVRLNLVFGFLLCINLFLCGISITKANTDSYKQNHFSHFISGNDFVLAKILEPCLEKEKSLKVPMQILAVKNNQEWVLCEGNAMFYFQKDLAGLELKYGDRLVLKTNFTDIKPPQNPSEFDYKLYLSFHNVYQQAYVKSGDWKFTGFNNGNFIKKFSYNLRDNLLATLRENNMTGDEYAVASALILGYEDKLDADVISAYASTGALHVLSVSGLHVGIVYIMLTYLFFFFDRFKFGFVIKAGLILVLIWFYAVLTGLSPSVLRSAAMFSFIIIGQSFKYNTNIFNTLAVSCFFLLMYNPFLIMEVGFQLSYLAVFGIVYIQPKLYDLWKTENWLLDKAWAITTVSIAAQLATFPLGLLYFHQFPNLFLFSNLLVIPVSTAILFLGIFLFAISKISFLAIIISKLLFWSTLFLNESVKWMEKIPHAIMQGISITIFETWMIYGVICLFVFFLIYKKKVYLYTSLLALIVVLTAQSLQSYYENKQKRFIVYSVPKASAMDFISGKKNILYADSSFAHNSSRLLFHVKHNWWNSGLNENNILENNKEWKDEQLSIQENFIQFCGKRIVIIDDKFSVKNISTENKINVDFVVLSKNPKLYIKDVTKVFSAKEIIIDGSNSNYRIQKWKLQCNDLGINCYSVAESGAFISEI